MTQISEKIEMLTSMFSGKSPTSQQANAEFYKNKYIEELENRVQINEKLAQKDELISKLLTRIKELEGGESVAEIEQFLVEEVDTPSKKPEKKQEEELTIVKPKKLSPVKQVSMVQPKTQQMRQEEKVLFSPKEKLMDTSDKDDEAKEEAYLDLDGDPLIAWNDVIKESHPGSLGQMPALNKKRLEASFTEFLRENLSEDKVQKCKVLNDRNKIVVALPERLKETFWEWLDVRTGQGMLDRGSLMKWKEEQTRLFGKVRNLHLII